ncbi:MAG: hypothetical protein ACOC9W_01445 [Persicimonas sp.]
MWTIEEEGYRIEGWTSFEFSGPATENIDVHVRIEGGGAHIATFYSLRCVRALMHKFVDEGEYDFPFFWERSGVFVEELTKEAVRKAVAELIRIDELPAAFEPSTS